MERHRIPGSPAWLKAQSPRRVRVRSEAEYWGPLFAAAAILIWLGAPVYGFRIACALFAVIGVTGVFAGFIFPAIGLFSLGMMAVLDLPLRVSLAGVSFYRDNTINYLMILALLTNAPLLLKRRDSHTWLISGLLGVMILELFMNESRDSWIRGILHILNGMSVLGMIVYFVRGVRDENIWYWLAVSNGLLGVMGGLMYYLLRSGFPEDMYFDRNGLAYFPLTSIFTIALGFRSALKRPGGAILLGTMAVICGCWVFLTTSRGGMLIGLFALLCLLAEMRGIGVKLMVAGVGCIVVLGILTQFTEIQDQSVSRWEKMFDDDRSWASRTSGRSDLMRGAWEMVQSHPWGVGTGGFASEYKEISQDFGRYVYGINHEASAHSAWLKALAENGFPGLLLLLAFVGSFAVEGFRKQKRGLLFLGLLPTVAMGVAFFTTEFQGKGVWFLAAGATVILHRRAMPVASVSTRAPGTLLPNSQLHLSLPTQV